MPPSGATVLHLIGDLHVGAISQTRLDKAIADMLTARVPVPDLHVQIGDWSENGLGSEDTAARAWLDALPADWITVIGNHDLISNRAPAAAMSAMGMPGQNFTRDIGAVRLVAVGTDVDEEMVLSQATLDWLDQTLAAADRDCLILCHAPLSNTVLGATTGADAQWSSAEAFFQIAPDAAIRSILDARTRAKAWISGHTHSAIETPGFFKSESVGSRSIAAINCSALYYVGRTAEPHDALRALYLSIFPDRLELRIRGHGAGTWGSIGSARVTTFAL